MERGWWWKAALYGVVTVLAVLYLVPTVVPEEKQPAFIKNHFQKKIQLGLDLQGGLHLVYEVNVDKAVSDKVDRLSSDIEDRLRTDKGVTDVNVVARERTRRHHPHVQEPGRPGQGRRPAAARVPQVARPGRAATPPTGVVRLRLDPDQIDEVRDYALRQGIETIRDRVDKLGVAEPTIIKKGTDIIVELPGLKPADFERIKNIIGRTAQLEFKIVDDGSDYMKKVAAAVPKRDEGAARPDRHRRSARGVDREGLGQAARGRLPALEEPRRAAEVLRRADRRPRRPARSRDRLRGDAGARRGRRADARQAAGAPTTCTSARR